jgi:helix-turn-helix protein
VTTTPTFTTCIGDDERQRRIDAVVAAVKQCGSYTSAARLLGVSQSTVTRWMQKANAMITTGRRCDDLRWRVIDGVMDNARMKLLFAFVLAAQAAAPSVAPRALPPLYRAEPVPCERFLTLLERHLGAPKILDPIKNWTAERNELTASIARLRAGAPLHGSCRSAQQGVSPRPDRPTPPPQP